MRCSSFFVLYMSSVRFCLCIVACELHGDRETETVGGRVNGGGRLPGTWALTLTTPKMGGLTLTREWALTWDNIMV